MLARQLIVALQREGFAIVRRSQSYVWLGRGEDVLLIDRDTDVDDDVAERLIARARTPLAEAEAEEEP